jgi:hypothetical protein
LNGTFTIADDIIIAGCGQTDEEAKRDHETKLCKLYARCKEQNSILNDKKKEIGLKEITFHGHTLDTFNPNGNCAQRYRPNGVIIVVNRLEFWLSLTCQYASLLSSLLNIRAFASFESTSSSVVKR